MEKRNEIYHSYILGDGFPLTSGYAAESPSIKKKLEIAKSIIVLEGCGQSDLVKQYNATGEVIDGVGSSLDKGSYVSSAHRKYFRVSKKVRPMLREALALSQQRASEFSSLKRVKLRQDLFARRADEQVVEASSAKRLTPSRNVTTETSFLLY